MNEIDYDGLAKGWALDAHRNQKRKVKDTPYVVHLDRVTELLGQVGADPEVRAAGWLHDIVEDQDVSLDAIRTYFGDRVARIVGDVTENGKNLPWAERKRQAEERVPLMSHDSLLVKSADVLSNMEETLMDYHRLGDAMFQAFNAPKEAQLAHKKIIVAAISSAWPENPLLTQLQQVYTQYEELLR